MYHEPLEYVRLLSGPSKQVRRVELRVCSSIAPSSLALPPEMAFQRATGGMPVHITVHRGLPKQLVHLHAAAVHTTRDPSARAFVIALLCRLFISRYGIRTRLLSQIELPDHARTDKYFLKVRAKFYISHVAAFCFKFIKIKIN